MRRSSLLGGSDDANHGALAPAGATTVHVVAEQYEPSSHAAEIGHVDGVRLPPFVVSLNSEARLPVATLF